jgi:predicted nucleic acid-binding protein
MPVVDASVVVDLLDPQTGAGAPAHVLMAKLANSAVDLVAPSLLWLEVSNVLLTGIRRGRWDGGLADSGFARCAQLPIRIADHPADRDRAFELARRYDNWPVYDMVYVALAERLGTQFYTADERLRARLAHLPWICGLSREPG